MFLVTNDRDADNASVYNDDEWRLAFLAFIEEGEAGRQVSLTFVPDDV